MSAVVDTDRSRRDDLAAIHIAKKSLGMDDDVYRDVMFTVCRVRSAAELDFTGRKRFMAHLRACQQASGRDGADLRARSPMSPRQRMLWSLWQRLADAGKVHERDAKALNAWVKRQTGVDRMSWLGEHQLDLVIECAKRWLARKEG